MNINKEFHLKNLLFHKRLKSPICRDYFGGVRREKSLDLARVYSHRIDGDSLAFILRGIVGSGTWKRLGRIINTTSLESIKLAQIDKYITFFY